MRIGGVHDTSPPRVRRQRGATPAGGDRATPAARDQGRPTSAAPADSQRLAGLDGLRAIAVTAVLIYHLWPGVLPGGFLGVDVFFVVSGFLITTLLLREAATRGRIDLPRFWLRRARRLLPALGLVVSTSIVVAALVDRDLLVGVRRQVLGAATFSTNWLEIASGSSYFDRTAPVLLQPLWSLAIEEQFYVLWPVVLVALLVLVPTWRGRAVTMVVVATASGIAMAVLVDLDDPTRVYYGTDTHLAGVVLGVAAAIAWRAARGRALVPVWAPPAGLAVVVAGMVLLRDDSAWTYRGGLVLVSSAALVVVLGATRPGRWTAALDAAPLRVVGERSYGLYLWHWPVLLIVTAAFGATPGTPVWNVAAVVTLVVTLVLTELSFRYVESPVRELGFKGAWAAVRERLLGVGVRRARVAIAMPALWTLALVVVLVTAPTMSSAQRMVADGLEAQKRATAAQPHPDSAGPSLPSTAPAVPATPTGPATPDGTQTTDEPKQPPRTTMPPKPAAVTGPVDGRVVSAFGDSVLSGVVPGVLQQVPGIAIDARPIRRWTDSTALLQAAAADGSLRDVVVLVFGTNAGLHDAASKDALRATLAAVGAERPVVLTTIVGVSSWVKESNDSLRAIAAERPGTHVADWHAVVAKTPGLLGADRTHASMAGMAAFAELLARTLATAGVPAAP